MEHQENQSVNMDIHHSEAGAVIMSPGRGVYTSNHQEVYPNIAMMIGDQKSGSADIPTQKIHDSMAEEYQPTASTSNIREGTNVGVAENYDEVFPALAAPITTGVGVDVEMNGGIENFSHAGSASGSKRGGGVGGDNDNAGNGSSTDAGSHILGNKRLGGNRNGNTGTGTGTGTGSGSGTGSGVQWKPKNVTNVTNAPKMRSTQVTQTFTIAPEERRYKEQSVFRDRDQVKTCQEIMQVTGTRIEMTSSKDGKLSFLISGKEQGVNKAWKMLSSAVQVRAERSVNIPREHHKFVLGKGGAKLRDLEERTNTKISVPRQEENSDVLRVLGTRDAIDRAIQELQSISHEAASKASEKFSIAKYMHPFIRGPMDELVNSISGECGVKINIPVDPNNEEITIMGELSAIAAAKSKILAVYEDKKEKVNSVKMEVKKSQHKYILGRGGATQKEIFLQTGVYVEIPPQDSDTETITLWGESEKIGPALQVLYEKAHSELEEEIETEAWIHRHVLGQKGANFHEMNQHFPNVRVSFEEDGKIRMRGPRNELPIAKKMLDEAIKSIKSRISILELKIDAKYHRFVIGKAGKAIQQIRDESKAKIQIPEESDHSASCNIIRIEGSDESVRIAKDMIDGIIVKQKERESEIAKEIAIDQRFHRNFIGTKGEKIREIREKFNQVQITFPPPDNRSDLVVIRGSIKDVDACYKYLAQETKSLQAQHYRLEVPVSKQYLKFLSREREKLHQIKSSTKTRIDLPPVPSDVKAQNCPPILISGKKEDCDRAKEMIQKLLSELSDYKQYDVLIPAKFHNILIGAKGRQIKAIKEECPGADILFPSENSGSEKVSIIGPQDVALKAKQMLIELKNERQENSFEAKVKARPELHSLIRRKSAGLSVFAGKEKGKERPNVRLYFPESDETNPQNREIIIIEGKKAIVQKAKEELESLIKELEKTVEESIKIPVKFHDALKRGNVMRQIKDELGDIQLTFPREHGDETILIRGVKECVEIAKSRLKKKKEELESQIEMNVAIPQQYHKIILRSQGKMVQSIQEQHRVEISFPKRADRSGPGTDSGAYSGSSGSRGGANAGESKNSNSSNIGRGDVMVDNETSSNPTQLVNGSEHIDEGQQKNDLISLKGSKEGCEAAKKALLSLIPVTVEIEVPFNFHRFIIGPKGAAIKEMKDKYEVTITVPPSNDQNNLITIRGLEKNVQDAKNAINERVGELVKEQQDREAKKYRVEMKVDPQYHSKIIGKGGKVVTKIKKDFGVQIQFPERGDDVSELITVVGYENDALKARDEILNIVKRLENMVSEEIEIASRVHPRLIGAKGRNIGRIMDKYRVEVKFPKENSGNPDLVVITGESENVEQCKEYLLDLAEDYLDDVVEQYRAPKLQADESNRPTNEKRGFYVKGGPWEQSDGGSQVMPDTSNSEEFPSMAGWGENSEHNPKSGWNVAGSMVVSTSKNE
ncbi:vigilin-like [Brevipalpus obovatus]|uniref:vigilin-like n=1 Tax=Brevipalpus obovatus TaxID=246614 RepID=UPI003D9F668C